MFVDGLFAGKKILVTGGGTGLGKAMAERFLGLGAEIAICGRRKSICDETAAELMKAHEGRVLSYGVDIRDAAAVESMVEEIRPPAPIMISGCSASTRAAFFSALNAVRPAHPSVAAKDADNGSYSTIGLAAINLCHGLYGASPIVADIDAAKRQAALEAGASSVVDPADPDARKRLLADTSGLALAIDFVGVESSAAFGLSLLRKGGRLFVVGLFGGSLGVPLATLPIRAVSIVGSFTGTLPEFRELLALAREGKVKPAPLETRPLGMAQQSLDDLRAGRVRGRVVLTV